VRDTTRDPIFGIYAIVVQIHLRIPLKPRVRKIKGKLKKALTFLYEITLNFYSRHSQGAMSGSHDQVAILHMAT
jgi:hypothetical protein